MSTDAIRRENDEYSLTRANAASDPIVQFRNWFEDAVHANRGRGYEPNAMTLATATPDGVPSARVVLLKAFDDRGFVFYSHYASAKGRELDLNPRAELVFHWAALERQVRVAGTVTRVSKQQSLAHFRGRPRPSQLGALASNQSQIVTNREQLETRLEELERQFADSDVPMPETWGGYRVGPVQFEFWQGRSDRLHDRLRYLLEDTGAWRIERVSP